MLTGIFDMGEREDSYKAQRGNPGVMRPEIVLVWTLDSRDSTGKRFKVYEWLSASTFEKATYAHRIAAMLDGYNMTEAEREDFNPACLLGRFVLMTLDNKRKDGSETKNPYVSRAIETDRSFTPDDGDLIDEVPRYCKKGALDEQQVEAWDEDLSNANPASPDTTVAVWRPGFDSSPYLPDGLSAVSGSATHAPSESDDSTPF
jgi:hypothetical protein